MVTFTDQKYLRTLGSYGCKVQLKQNIQNKLFKLFLLKAYFPDTTFVLTIHSISRRDSLSAVRHLTSPTIKNPVRSYAPDAVCPQHSSFNWFPPMLRDIFSHPGLYMFFYYSIQERRDITGPF